jgi:ferredoxin-thioredoxin reductase catalytic chain
MTEIEKLYDLLKKAQEPKGYYFNKDRERVNDLLSSLLLNKARYGYMACPCRLATGERQADADIVCPCLYRTPDVQEFGSCYCNLYVSADWNKGVVSHRYIPERRPASKLPF